MILYFQFSPPEARPPEEVIVQALAGCTRFRLQYDDRFPGNLDSKRLHWVEFETLDKARKAKALLTNLPLRNGSEGCTVTLTDTDGKMAIKTSPTTGRLLNVTELPPEFTASDVYDKFIGFGIIESCTMDRSGAAKVTFAEAASAKVAQLEMNFMPVESYQIIVRFPSKQDAKDSFKSPRPYSGPRYFDDTSRYSSPSASASPAHRSFDASARSARPMHRNMSATFGINADVETPRSTAGMPRSVSQPLRITDPTRLIIQNVPEDAGVEELFAAFQPFGDLAEANVAVHPTTGKRLGVAIVRYNSADDAASALRNMNGRPTLGEHRAVTPLLVRMFEPKGITETGLRLEQAQGTPAASPPRSLKASAAPFLPAAALSPSLAEETIATTGNAQEASTPPRPAEIASVSIVSNLSPESTNVQTSIALQKHRRLLMMALQDLNEPRAGDLADILLRLPEEERKKCIFEEAYLIKKVAVAKDLYLDVANQVDEENIAPSAASNGVTNTSDKLHQPLPSNAQRVSDAIGLRPSEGENMKSLAAMPARDLMALATAASPPALLSLRNATTIEETDEFLDSIKSLKPSQQKQKCGERIFKVFKARAAGMKSLSKKTIALLDEEDLDALMHLCAEFPDVLVAKASAMSS